MINSFKQSQFTHIDGTVTRYYLMPAPKSKRLIIQHPDLSFDDGNYEWPLLTDPKPDSDIYSYRDSSDQRRKHEARVYYEKYVMNHFSEDTLTQFIRLSEQNWALSKDEILWGDTSYWSINDQSNYYIGRGEFALFDTMRSINEASFALCIDARDFMVILQGESRSGQVKANSTITIYACNLYLPFADILEPFRKALNSLEDNELRQWGWISDYDMRVSHFDLRSVSGSLLPEAIIWGQGFFTGQVALVVIENDFASFPISDVNGLKHILAGINGGYVEGDFKKHPNLCLVDTIMDYDSVIIIDSELIIRPDPEVLAKLQQCLTKFPGHISF